MTDIISDLVNRGESQDVKNFYAQNKNRRRIE